MTTLHEAAQKALELCEHIRDAREVWSMGELHSVCLNLRSALAQQGEPVAWVEGPSAWKDWCGQWFGPDCDDAYLAKAVFELPPMAQKFRNAAAPAPHPDTRTVVQQMVDALKYYADEPDDLGYDALAAGQQWLEENK